jgi:DNA topoisomerase IB
MAAASATSIQKGGRVSDEDTLERIRAMAIPPAWRDVWICADPFGHIQATGLDEAGRKQYLYHERWQLRAAQRKFESMREFAVGGEEYAETNESYGVATVLCEHVSIEDEAIVFDFPAKSGQRRVQSIHDPEVKAVIEAMRRRRSGPDDLLVYRENGGWRDVRSEEVNEYLQAKAGEEFSAKDFRTWHGTVLAAVELARERAPSSKGEGERAIRAAVKRVAELLGNTPAVCRSSYIDPRILDRFRDGKTIEIPRA